MPAAMTRTERDQFLAGVHIGMLAVDEPGRGPLALPVWYDYEPGGDIWFCVAPDSHKLTLLRAAGRASLLAQTEQPPYAYVSVEGPVTIAPTTWGEHPRALARRYLGAEMGERYIAAQPADTENTLVRLTPHHWRTFDYGKP
jgi:nitroimidazol reductase NimA-like FMN-containing flavoprotein (pyridoxamine 5'-phosphate oxidase superfamily)